MNKNLYRKKTYYTLVIEQDVLANDKDDMTDCLILYILINHSKINKDITDSK